MQVVSMTEARNSFKSIFDAVFHNHEEVIIHRKGRENVVMIPLDEYNALKETSYLLGNQKNAEHLFESIEQLRHGNVVTKEMDDLSDR
ncbi:type II toxin-antitoxin system Phd/YefM family antitoxin [Nitratifractor sp.]|uniref:type II toxin-antitoxin system Phd/YefM family antitoxin n=1 Tax=Nitratifractor sp. TaxID=2268144 RepID=UPI0025EAFCA7|nr:type II toxin-antitoxin system prevent-host-death family antitoxin [Nitratifractor sp.]